MRPVFLINGSVLFEPDKRRLGPRDGYPNRAVLLHGPVSECLLLLLEHNGEVLTQRYLFSAVWEKQGAIVTTNALYQTIASIRKALKSVGLAENIVQTVPKEGFKAVADLQSGTLEEFILPAVSALKDGQPEEEKACLPAPVVRPRKNLVSSKLAYGTAALLFLMSCFVLYQQLKPGDAPFADYHFIGNVEGCDVYSSLHDKMQSQNKFTSLVKRYPVQCSAGGRVYITLNHYQQGTSVIVCDKQADLAGAQCESILYREQYYETD